ncbi:MAP3K epsilon protein kinase 1 [Pelomyxa schiedti]|nr:MAP3K epsilon protein kinase 1 [Pelomyxa schiedti]
MGRQSPTQQHQHKHRGQVLSRSPRTRPTIGSWSPETTPLKEARVQGTPQVPVSNPPAAETSPKSNCNTNNGGFRRVTAAPDVPAKGPPLVPLLCSLVIPHPINPPPPPPQLSPHASIPSNPTILSPPSSTAQKQENPLSPSFVRGPSLLSQQLQQEQYDTSVHSKQQDTHSHYGIGIGMGMGMAQCSDTSSVVSHPPRTSSPVNMQPNRLAPPSVTNALDNSPKCPRFVSGSSTPLASSLPLSDHTIKQILPGLTCTPSKLSTSFRNGSPLDSFVKAVQPHVKVPSLTPPPSEAEDLLPAPTPITPSRSAPNLQTLVVSALELLPPAQDQILTPKRPVLRRLSSTSRLSSLVGLVPPPTPSQPSNTTPLPPSSTVPIHHARALSASASADPSTPERSPCQTGVLSGNTPLVNPASPPIAIPITRSTSSSSLSSSSSFPSTDTSSESSDTCTCPNPCSGPPACLCSCHCSKSVLSSQRDRRYTRSPSVSDIFCSKSSSSGKVESESGSDSGSKTDPSSETASDQEQKPESNSSTPRQEPSSETTSKRSTLTTLIGKISIGETIGRGATAVVFKGLVESGDRCGEVVALKRLDANVMSKDFSNSIKAEISLLQKLQHPHIVSVLGQYEMNSQLFIILEYAENGSLANLTREFGSLPEPLVVLYTRQVLNAVEYLHKENVIHRDLKAGNVLLSRSGGVKLADFGVAAVIKENIKHYSVVGSPYWMSPEIIQREGHCAASDIWSLGCTVIELLTGSPPFYGSPPMTAMYKIVQEEIPLPTDISAEMQDFLKKCFIKTPEDRPSASILLQHPLFRSHQHDDMLPMDVKELKRTVRYYRRTKSTRNLAEYFVPNTPTDPRTKTPKTPLPPGLVEGTNSLTNLQEQIAALQRNNKQLEAEREKIKLQSDMYAASNKALSDELREVLNSHKQLVWATYYYVSSLDGNANSALKKEIQTHFRMLLEQQYQELFPKPSSPATPHANKTGSASSPASFQRITHSHSFSISSISSSSSNSSTSSTGSPKSSPSSPAASPTMKPSEKKKETDFKLSNPETKLPHSARETPPSEKKHRFWKFTKKEPAKESPRETTASASATASGDISKDVLPSTPERCTIDNPLVKYFF